MKDGENHMPMTRIASFVTAILLVLTLMVPLTVFVKAQVAAAQAEQSQPDTSR